MDDDVEEAIEEEEEGDEAEVKDESSSSSSLKIRSPSDRPAPPPIKNILDWSSVIRWVFLNRRASQL